MFTLVDFSGEYKHEKDRLKSLSAMINVILELGYRYLLINDKLSISISSKENYEKRNIIRTFCLLDQCENSKAPIKAVNLSGSSNIMRWIKHPEVSFIFMNVVDAVNMIDRSTINLAKQYYKFIGIDFKQLFYRDDKHKLIRAIKKRLIQYLNKRNMRYIFFVRIESPYELVSPRQLRSALTLLGIRDYIIKHATKTTPKIMLMAPYEFQGERIGLLELASNNK